MMQESKTIVLYGWYGAGNLGDELLLTTLLNWAKYKSLRPIVISYDPKHTQRTHNVEAIDAEDLPTIANAIGAAEACILGGGGIFQTHNTFTYSGLFHFGMGDISAYARPLLIANQLNTPTLLIGQGIGPLTNDASKDITFSLFSMAQLASVRDESSLMLLRSIGVDRDLLLAPDLAWTHTLPDRSSRSIDVHRRARVAFVVRPWRNTQEFQLKLASAIKLALDPARHTLVWFPFQCHTIPNRSESDEYFVRACMALMGSEWQQEIITEEKPQRTIQELAHCDSMVAMRLHAQIIAYKLDLPVVSIEYDAKMEAVSDQMGQASVLRVRPDDPLEVWTQALGSLCSDQQHYKSFSERSAEITKQAKYHLTALSNYISNNERSSSKQRGVKLHDVNWFEYWLVWTCRKIEERCTFKAEAQIQLLNNTITDRDSTIVQLSEELIRVKNSISWRITLPIRMLKGLVVEPRRSTYEILRALFRLLPDRLKGSLNGTRHTTQRLLRVSSNTPSKGEAKRLSTDLSWEEFKERILSKRSHFKGVFIQEFAIEWNAPLYQRPQHIASALGKLGYLVIYRTVEWPNDNINGFREVSENVWITNRHEIDYIERTTRSVYSTAHTLTAVNVMTRDSPHVWIYEYIDHIDPEISGDQENIRRLLELKALAFSGGADFVVASAAKLYKEAADAIGKNRVIFIPNGVDTLHYRNSKHKNTVIAPELLTFKKQKKHMVGYFGALAPWLWYEALRELALERPEIGFVFIGPDYHGGSSQLPKLDNVLYLGIVDYKILPAFAQQFDVCFIPFKQGEIAKTTSPLKLFEYFALEKPIVVTSDMIECTAFEEVFSGNSASSLSTAIDSALAVKDDPSYKARLRKLADQNSWIRRAQEFEVCFNIKDDE